MMYSRPAPNLVWSGGSMGIASWTSAMWLCTFERRVVWGHV